MSTPNYFFIRNKRNGLVLDIAAENPPPGTPIMLYKLTGEPHQQWTINEQGVIVSKLNGFAAIDGDKGIHEAAVVNPVNNIATQQWLTNERNLIKNKGNNLYLESSGDRPLSPVTLSPIRASIPGHEADPRQQWEFVPVEEEVPPPTPLYFFIKSKQNGLVLDIAGGNPAPGTPIVLYKVNGEPHQQWTINRDGVIVSQLNGFAIDGYKGSNEVAVVNPVNNTATQQWLTYEKNLIQNKGNGFVLGSSGDELLSPVLVEFPRAPIPGHEADPRQEWEFVPVEEEVPPLEQV